LSSILVSAYIFGQVNFVSFGYGGFVLISSQFSKMLQLPQKKDFKNGKNRLKNNHLTSSVQEVWLHPNDQSIYFLQIIVLKSTFM
jgi:hypothetical protein